MSSMKNQSDRSSNLVKIPLPECGACGLLIHPEDRVKEFGGFLHEWCYEEIAEDVYKVGEELALECIQCHKKLGDRMPYVFVGLDTRMCIDCHNDLMPPDGEVV